MADYSKHAKYVIRQRAIRRAEGRVGSQIGAFELTAFSHMEEKKLGVRPVYHYNGPNGSGVATLQIIQTMAKQYAKRKKKPS
jgi:hypothetical protein